MTSRNFIEQRLRRSFLIVVAAVELGGTLAQRVITQLISDLSGDEVVQGEGETVEFSYRGTSYTIDLTAKEPAGFDKAVAMYIEHATKVSGARKRVAPPATSTGSGRSKGRIAEHPFLGAGKRIRRQRARPHQG